MAVRSTHARRPDLAGWRRAVAMAGGIGPRTWVCVLAGCLTGAVTQAAPSAAATVAADAQPGGIIGTWVSVAGAERVVVLPGGYLRTCFTGGQRGNAAMGQWRRLGPGRYAVEFTHVAAPDCNRPPVALRQHPASIQGLAVVSDGELALHVSGEFPPDRFRPLDRNAR